MYVKICGITNLEDALSAAESGADAIGFILAPESPRYVTPEKLERIISRLPTFITTVGVFTEAKIGEIQKIIDCCGIDRIQFHGPFSTETIQNFSRRAIQVIRIKDPSSLESVKPVPVRAYLLDTQNDKMAGGSGKTFDWEIAVSAKRLGRIILAGGLTPGNVRAAIRKVDPFGVDVSSGVESEKGKKDPGKLNAFIQAAKEIA